MNIVFYSITLNHHQAPIADELWEITNHNFTFVELSNIVDTKGATYDFAKRPYLLQCWKNKNNYEKAMQLAITADVCVFAGIESLPFEKARLKLGLLSFEMGERWLKRGFINLLSPKLIHWLREYHLNDWRNMPLYKLCCSSFCAKDHYILRSFINKCYKWGYFPQLPEVKISIPKNVNTEIKIMWCSRFLKLKHPEIAIQAISRLKALNYNISLHMFGNGEYEEYCKSLAQKLNLNNTIIFHGSIPNSDVLNAMKIADIFLFTSDRNEGWGAVANESMSNGCVLVASDAIGSTSYLIKDNVNGCIFKSGNIDSLVEKIKSLLDAPEEMRNMQINAINTIRNIWNPKNAAQSFIHLVMNLQKGIDTDIIEGPCSKAQPLL